MDIARVPAIIIAPPGLLRDSLKVVMEASGRVSFVGVEDDWVAGLKMINALSPKLVVLDTANLGDKFSWQVLQQFHLEQPRVPYCIVVHTREEERLAQNAGARIVLQAGFSTKIFFDAIAKLTSVPSVDPIETNGIGNQPGKNSNNGSDKQGGGESPMSNWIS